jgi:ectoine hydroxylase-related dioxygenase (phytanoyl-CoA dioxygenase family)
MEEAAVLEKIDKCTNGNDLGDGAAGSGDTRVTSEEHGEEVQEEHPGIVSPRLNQGDALLYDYRVCHRGTSNLTQGTRRILYLMYARPWFKEHLNFGTKRLFPEANWRE